MAESSTPLLHGWRYGIHPSAAGLKVDSLGRVDLPLGEALRLELVNDEPGASENCYLQYYISTEVGPWALWLTCPRGELADREATLQKLAHPLADES